jgi:hypothetical protein
MEVTHRLGIGVHQAGLAVRDASLLAESLDQRLQAAQVGPGHGRKQVVFDLVVQAAERKVGQPAT